MTPDVAAVVLSPAWPIALGAMTALAAWCLSLVALDLIPINE